jgi:hypothetical protein
MINRTYVVKTPSSSRDAFIDICVRATMGTRLAPVAHPGLFPPGASITPPPADWAVACGDGAYYEIRGRTLCFEHLSGEGAVGGFTQRTNLGFILSVTPYGAPNLGAGIATLTTTLGANVISAIAHGTVLSASLLAAVGGDTAGAIPNTVLADPVYGVAQPVIRIFKPAEINTEGQVSQLYIVNLSIAERKDEDYDNTGSP